GLLAGLADGGADVSRADWILGTSAGSFVGAHLAMGRNPAAMLKAEFAAADIVREASGDPRPAPDLTPLMSVMMSKPPGEVMPLDGRMKLAAMALDAKTVTEDTFIAGFGPLAEGEHPWPTGYACTAVDTADGELVIWDEDKAAPLIRAIASSCSVPTIFPPITIDGLHDRLRGRPRVAQAAVAQTGQVGRQPAVDLLGQAPVDHQHVGALLGPPQLLARGGRGLHAEGSAGRGRGEHQSRTTELEHRTTTRGDLGQPDVVRRGLTVAARRGALTHLRPPAFRRG
ncbi:MAG: patatin-like phospholipase family protein, partial [Actinobacteria bacterium]|nr:patatin-like phospholipase family protein [Actinomycetota bacterium]